MNLNKVINIFSKNYERIWNYFVSYQGLDTYIWRAGRRKLVFFEISWKKGDTNFLEAKIKNSTYSILWKCKLTIANVFYT